MKISYQIYLLIFLFLINSCSKYQNGDDMVMQYHLFGYRDSETINLAWVKTYCTGIGDCPNLEADEFEIMMSKGDMNNFQKIATISSWDTMFIVENLENGTQYFFELVAKNGKKNFSKSKTINLIPNPNNIVTHLLPNIDKDVYSASWSSDKKYLSYYTYEDLLFYQEVGDISPILIANESRSPHFAPDNEMIVYATENELPRFHSDIEVYNTSTQSKSKIVSNFGFAFQPSWSQDGAWIAFYTNDTGTNSINIYKVSSSGGVPIRINTNPEISSFDSYLSPIEWSLDGSQLFLTLGAQSNGNVFKNKAIYSIPSNGGALTLLNPASIWSESKPALSSDGQKLAFISNRSGYDEVWVMNLSDNSLQQITSDKKYSVSSHNNVLSWSGDSKYILFNAYDGKNYTLFQVAL